MLLKVRYQFFGFFLLGFAEVLLGVILFLFGIGILGRATGLVVFRLRDSVFAAF